MNESILETVKKVLGLPVEDTFFDTDLIVHINAVIITLHQLAACKVPVYITGASDTWDIIAEEGAALSYIKSYVPLKVRMAFDPPQSSAVAEAIKNTISELEFRIICQFDVKEEDTP